MTTTYHTHVALGDVASFGNVLFDDYSTEKITYDWELIQALVSVPGSPFPANRYGVSAIPYKMPLVEATMVMLSPYGTNMIPLGARTSDRHIDLQTKVNQLIDKWLSVDPFTGIAGHTDILQIWDASRAFKWNCTAFLYKAPVASEAGKNWQHVKIVCSWVLMTGLVNVGP